MSPLTSTQRKALRGMAHALDPVVRIGKAGLSDAVVESVDRALLAHELVKVRFGDLKDEKKPLVERLCERLGAESCGLIGHVVILYRPHPDEEERRIQPPKARGQGNDG